MPQRERIREILQDLLGFSDVKACMVAKKGLEGIVPEENEIKDINLWKLIRRTTDDFFTIIHKFYDYNLRNIYFEIENYDINLTVLNKQTALIVIFPSLANKGLLEVEIENTRRELLRVFGE